MFNKTHTTVQVFYMGNYEKGISIFESNVVFTRDYDSIVILEK